MVLLSAFALLAGAGTALSPCVLPVLPALLSAGATGGRRRPLGIVAGLSVTFTATIVGFAAVSGAVGIGDAALRDVAIGAMVTSLLFAIGKLAIGLYLGHSGTASTYGAAGSLVVLLLWVYYSAQILFFGAEFTQIYANRYGKGIKPAADATAMFDQMRPKDYRPDTEHDSTPKTTDKSKAGSKPSATIDRSTAGGKEPVSLDARQIAATSPRPVAVGKWPAPNIIKADGQDQSRLAYGAAVALGVGISIVRILRDRGGNSRRSPVGSD
jgi:Zn-dependent protease with chaperone function